VHTVQVSAADQAVSRFATGTSGKAQTRHGESESAETGEPGHQPSRAPITTRTRASIFAPEGFGSYGNSNIPWGYCPNLVGSASRRV
jgi:hypothetical protein